MRTSRIRYALLAALTLGVTAVPSRAALAAGGPPAWRPHGRAVVVEPVQWGFQFRFGAPGHGYYARPYPYAYPPPLLYPPVYPRYYYAPPPPPVYRYGAPRHRYYGAPPGYYHYGHRRWR